MLYSLSNAFKAEFSPVKILKSKSFASIVMFSGKIEPADNPLQLTAKTLKSPLLYLNGQL